MGVEEEIRAKLMQLRQDPNAIEFFREYALQNLRTYPEKMKMVMEQVLAIGKEQQDNKISAEALLYLGWYDYDNSQFSQAIEKQEEAKELFQEIEDYNGKIRAYNALIMDCMEVGLFKDALENSIKGLELAEKIQENTMIMPLTLNSCVAYIELGKYDLAWQQVEQVKKFKDECYIQDELTLNSICIELSYRQENYATAKDYCAKGLAIVEKIGGDFYMPEIYYCLGKIAYKQRKHEEAEEAFKKGIACGNKHNRKGIVVEILMFYGKELIAQGREQEGEEKLIEAVKSGESLNMQTTLIKLYECLNKFYAKKGDYKKAYEILSKYVACENRIGEQSRAIANVKLKYHHFKHTAKKYEELYHNIENVSNVGKQIIATLQLNKTLDTIYQEIQEVVDADIFAIGILDEPNKKLHYDLAFELGQAVKLDSTNIEESRSLGAYCIKNKKGIHINYFDREIYNYMEESRILNTAREEIPQSIIFQPLMVGEQVLGILSVQNYKANFFSKKDFEALKKLSSYVSIAIHNAKLFEQVNYLAKYDELTGIYQRREIINLAQQIKTSKADEMYLSLIMVDVDHFKEFNDTYGHVAGDEVLRAIATHLKEQVKGIGYVGRYGGEEFIAVCEHTSKFDCVAYANQMRESIGEHEWKFNGNCARNITISIGLYTLKDDEDIMTGLKYADRALYIAKNSGRNKVCS